MQLQLHALRRSENEARRAKLAFASARGQTTVFLYRDQHRYYSDDDLQSAWELFEAKDYDAALARARSAVERTGRNARELNGLATELACMILRRCRELTAEQELLWAYFRRSLGSQVTAANIVALAVPPWEAGNVRLLEEYDVIPQDHTDQEPRSLETRLRPAPAMWEMATRFQRVTQRLEKEPERNEDRLTTALARLPDEDAFKVAAICVRKLVADHFRTGQNPRNELLRLHVLAQQHAFLYGRYKLGWNENENRKDAKIGLYPHVAARIATAAELDAIVLPFREAGYAHLPLLNGTDVKRLVKALGEPAAHIDPRKENAKLWASYRRRCRDQRRSPGA
jgi:hypothetical protein